MLTACSNINTVEYGHYLQEAANGRKLLMLISSHFGSYCQLLIQYIYMYNATPFFQKTLCVHMQILKLVISLLQ